MDTSTLVPESIVGGHASMAQPSFKLGIIAFTLSRMSRMHLWNPSLLNRHVPFFLPFQKSDRTSLMRALLSCTVAISCRQLMTNWMIVGTSSHWHLNCNDLTHMTFRGHFWTMWHTLCIWKGVNCSNNMTGRTGRIQNLFNWISTWHWGCLVTPVLLLLKKLCLIWFGHTI